MTTELTAILAYLQPERAKALKELSVETRIPKSALVREAVDDLLVKYGRLKPRRRKT